MNLGVATSPPQLGDLTPLLKRIPADRHVWIAEKHVQYLDDRIHKIDQLTRYLAGCVHVETERNALMSFILEWTQKRDADLTQYLREYASEFATVRLKVETLCHAYLDGTVLAGPNNEFLSFWEEFCHINEVDSIFGMFLTSGRWYVNAQLPIVKELVFCFIRGRTQLSAEAANECAYRIARRLITPCYAENPVQSDQGLQRDFGVLFMPVLQFYDRKLCFMFDLFTKIEERSFRSVSEFAKDVQQNAYKYAVFLEQGIYPPFGWHELRASKKPRREQGALQQCCSGLLASVPAGFAKRAETALECLGVLKDFELNYNNYNYKGAFGLVSKLQYFDTAAILPLESRQEFIEAILLDRFYDALHVIKKTIK